MVPQAWSAAQHSWPVHTSPGWQPAPPHAALGCPSLSLSTHVPASGRGTSSLTTSSDASGVGGAGAVHPTPANNNANKTPLHRRFMSSPFVTHARAPRSSAHSAITQTIRGEGWPIAYRAPARPPMFRIEAASLVSEGPIFDDRGTRAPPFNEDGIFTQFLVIAAHDHRSPCAENRASAARRLCFAHPPFRRRTVGW